MVKRLLAGFCALSLVAACAQSPEQITAAPVSNSQYAGMSCQQLSREAERINSEVARLTGVQQKAAQSDGAATAVSLFLFWPAMFMVGSSGDAAPQLAQAKGQQTAIREVWTQRGCG